MSHKPGYIKHTIKVSRVNAKSLKHPNVYLLFDPLKNIKHRTNDIFNYVSYFDELVHHEKFERSTSIILNAASPYVFCMFMGSFIKHLYEKYGASTIYYNPTKNNYYCGGILGFYFDDFKRRLLFEMQYNSLREKHLSI